MREVMGSYPAWVPSFRPDRKKPLLYRSGSLVVLGHYESPCGGCDTVGSARAVYDLIQSERLLEISDVVLCEGLLLSEDTKWTTQLAETHEVRVVFLTTGLEECLTRIKGRRGAVGNDKPLSPDNTANRVAVIERARRKLAASGILVRRASSEQAPGLVRNWIGQATR